MSRRTLCAPARSSRRVVAFSARWSGLIWRTPVYGFIKTFHGTLLVALVMYISDISRAGMGIERKGGKRAECREGEGWQKGYREREEERREERLVMTSARGQLPWLLIKNTDRGTGREVISRAARNSPRGPREINRPRWILKLPVPSRV